MNEIKLFFNSLKTKKALNITYIIACYVLAFFVPFFLTINLFRINGYTPFSNAEDAKTILMIDLRGQYITYFRYYKMILDGDYNLIYTLGKTAGGDMLSIFTYYLASPFNLLLAFFSIDEIQHGIAWIVVVKVAFSGLTSFFALQKLNKNGFVNLIFSFAYALVAYNFIYYSNVMWLDGVLILPLVTCGIVLLVRQKKPIMYVLSLSYAIATSWYIGIMIAIFSVLFFLVHYISKNKRYEKHEVIFVFIVSSFLAGFISLGMWGSALKHLFGTKGASSFTNLSETIKLFYNVFDIERGFVFGGYNGMSDINGNTIAMYVGAIPLILCLLFLGSKQYKLSFKILSVVLFALYLFAFFNKGIDHLMHGGPPPNWFPARYSFIVSFIVIYYASISFKELKTIHPVTLIVPLGLYFLLMLSFKNLGGEINPKSTLFFFLSFSIITFTILMYKFLPLLNNRNTKLSSVILSVLSPVSAISLAFISVINVYGNADHILKTFDTTLTSHVNEEMMKKDSAIGKAIDFIKNIDDGLYRTEKSFIRSSTYNNADNDALYFGYNGISHYSSSQQKDVSNYANKLGFHYNGFNVNYANGSTLATNTYLGIKYLVDNGTNRLFDLTKTLPLVSDAFAENIKVYENPYALPLMFGIDDTNISYVGEGVLQEDQTIKWFDKFEYQNNIFKTITNKVVDEEDKPKDIFKKASYTTSYNGFTPTEDYKFNVSENGIVNFYVTTEATSNYYYYIDVSDRNDLTLRTNGLSTTYFSYHGYQINSLKHRLPNATISVQSSTNKMGITLKEAIYVEDKAVLEEYVETIKNAVPVNLKQITTSKYQAEVISPKDGQHMLFTLPYDKSFKITVNNKRVETTTRFNVFTGFTVPKAGINTIKITYQEPLFNMAIPFAIIGISTLFVTNYFYQNKIVKKQFNDELIN